MYAFFLGGEKTSHVAPKRGSRPTARRAIPCRGVTRGGTPKKKTHAYKKKRAGAASLKGKKNGMRFTQTRTVIQRPLHDDFFFISEGHRFCA